MNMNYIICNIF